MVERQESRMEGRFYPSPEDGNMLKAMFQRQEAFAKRFRLSRNMPPAKISSWIKELCICQVAEQIELLEEVNWKHHKKEKKEIDIEAARMEVIDCWKYLMNQAITLGMTADDFWQYDQRKAEINEKRQKDGY